MELKTQIEKMREALQLQEAKRSGNTSTERQITQTYNHWDIPENTTALIRLLPDANQDNLFVWQERQTIHIPFIDENNKPITIRVPCMHQYGEKDNILEFYRSHWNGTEEDKAEARKYYKHRSYIMQGFVQKDPLNQVIENPIRKFVVSTQIFNIIKATILDEEFNIDVTDYTNGLDFKIAKTMKSKYADYSTSGFVRSTSSLTDDQFAAIEKYGLKNLSDDIPTKPDAKAQAEILEMFEASRNGELFDSFKWGHWRK